MLCQTKAFFQSIQVARGSHIKHRGQFPELGSPFLREVKRCNTVTIYTTNSRPCQGPHSIPGLTSRPRCALLRLPSLLMSPLAANATCCLLKHSRVMSGTMEYQMAGIQGREVRIEACRHKKKHRSNQQSLFQAFVDPVGKSTRVWVVSQLGFPLLR